MKVSESPDSRSSRKSVFETVDDICPSCKSKWKEWEGLEEDRTKPRARSGDYMRERCGPSSFNTDILGSPRLVPPI